MRIAVVVGMIRVGRRRGIMSHPGLLLIDAPTADELSEDVVRQVLQTLYDVGSDIPDMQVLITSIENAVWDIFDPSRIITSATRRELF
jgi:ABC-type ATPase involved in cell division